MSTEESDQNKIKETAERTEHFEALFRDSEILKTKKGTDRTWRVALSSDDVEDDLFVHRVNHKDFWYNVDNTRIIASKETWEAANSPLLDPVKHVKEIEDFLQNNPSYGDKTTEELTEDIRKAPYLKEPILISEGGVVWNGNRRLSIVRWLLENEYDQRYETVPACLLPHMSYDELKALEGRLQVKKTFLANYGTIEIRLRIRQAIEIDHWDWDKINKAFGAKWKTPELKTMFEEIKFVDKYLSRMNRPKDYAYIYYKAGGQKSRGGIEIFRTASTNERSFREELIPEDKQKQQDPVEYSKRLTLWFQQLSLPKVSHDTIREFNTIMNNDQARKEFFASDETYQNHDEYTTTMMDSQDGKQIEKTFSVEVLKTANENRITAAPYAAATSKDPKTFAVRALKSLREIDMGLIPKNNSTFKTTIQDIQNIINKIIKSKNYDSS